MSDKQTLEEKIDEIFSEHLGGEWSGNFKEEIVTLIEQEKREFAEYVIGADTDIQELEIARLKNIKGDRNGADVAVFDRNINIETWNNNLRAFQRERAGLN